jgi:hypothetical protein
MTDGRRFSIAPPNPDDAHLRYFGGGLVSFVFALVDTWRSRTLLRRPARAQPPSPRPIGSMATDPAPSATAT